MEHVEFTYTAGMDRETVEERLRSAETGVLSLADADDAYAVPLAFHYDGGDVILLRLGTDGGSEKMDFLQATDRACFVVYEYAGPEESWSVLATGRLDEVAQEDERYDAAEVNRAFPQLRVFDEEIADLEVALYELRLETITGRETL